MSWRRIGVASALVTALLQAVDARLQAQASEPPADARVRIGGLAVAPTVQVTNLGHDGNVFNDSENPTTDFTATVRPAFDVWLQLPRVRVSSRAELDYVYFNQLVHLRSLDTANSGRIELLFNRVTPYINASLASTRHRRNLEIDALARRRNTASVVGVDVRLTEKTSIDLKLLRSSLEYEEEAIYLDTNLARSLNRSATGEGVTLRYALTPLTTIAFDVERERDRFDFATERNSDSLRVAPAVEFKPFALVSGRASVGLRKRTFHDPQIPAFEGTAVRVDLAYTLLGRTRFAVTGERDLASSYRVNDSDYVSAGLSVSVTHQLAEPWDVGFSFGRSRLTYRTGQFEGGTLAHDRAETLASYGGGIGYRLGRTRLGLNVNYHERQSQVGDFRRYDRVSIGSSIAYTF